MEYQIEGGNTFPLVRVLLNKDESIRAESGSMVAMSRGLELKGKMDGGLKRALGRMFTGESFFLQTITAQEDKGWALLSTAQVGSIGAIEINNEEWIIQKNGFVAATEGIDMTTKAQSLSKGFLSGEGFFVIRLKGQGTAFISTYGAMHTLDIPAGETIMVDNGHLVAWHADLKYKITKGAKGWVSSVTSGEGLACLFQGPGKLIIQTRNPRDFGNWIQQFLPPPPQAR